MVSVGKKVRINNQNCEILPQLLKIRNTREWWGKSAFLGASVESNAPTVIVSTLIPILFLVRTLSNPPTFSISELQMTVFWLLFYPRLVLIFEFTYQNVTTE